jgi:signal transduction histidine kinase
VKYVILSDNANIPLVSRGIVPGGITIAQFPLSTAITQYAEGVRIGHDPRSGWVMETRFPLKISQKTWGNATIGFDAEPIRNEIRRFFFLLFGTTIIVSCVTLAVLYIFANRITRSLHQLVVEIDSVEIESESSPAVPQQHDEIDFLFYRFDLMKKRVEQARQQVEYAQHQVYQAEKLASIGRLASGVAHQVNNPLNGIKSCLFAIRKEPGNFEQTRDYAELINEGIINIETVVQKLLGFARLPSYSVNLIDINESTEKVVNLLELRLREKNIRLTLRLEDHIPPVRMDHHLFQEVVMNLLLNSYDAVRENGAIVITTRKQDAASVFLSIEDDGMGIREADVKKIFDPFFTTKEIGTGTGLGLSVCMSIVERHGGNIQVHSTEGEGALFTVILPIGNEHEDLNY